VQPSCAGRWKRSLVHASVSSEIEDGLRDAANHQESLLAIRRPDDDDRRGLVRRRHLLGVVDVEAVEYLLAALRVNRQKLPGNAIVDEEDAVHAARGGRVDHRRRPDIEGLLYADGPVELEWQRGDRGLRRHRISDETERENGKNADHYEKDKSRTPRDGEFARGENGGRRVHNVTPDTRQGRLRAARSSD